MRLSLNSSAALNVHLSKKDKEDLIHHEYTYGKDPLKIKGKYQDDCGVYHDATIRLWADAFYDETVAINRPIASIFIMISDDEED